MQSSKLLSYIIGFLSSIILTLAAFELTIRQMVHGNILITILLSLAFLQLIVQLLTFLHLSHESKPRWNLLFFISTLVGCLILVIGSIWIMQNLNYHMSPQEIENKIIENEGIAK